MDDRIKHVLDHIERNISERFTLDQLSKLAHLSSSQFHRLFKKETGTTPFKLVEKLKLTIAYNKIIEENIQVLTLAFDLGYQDYETFSRAFKKVYHFSPDDLRAISNRIREHSGVTSAEKFVVLALEHELDESEMPSMITKFARENDISESSLQEAIIYRIDKSSNQDDDESMNIKNKFRMSEIRRIWESLIPQKR